MRFTSAIRRFSSGKTVGFVGLGQMGTPMVRNLQKSGYDVVVHDTDPSKVKEFTRHTEKLSDLAKTCPRIITMLPSNESVERVYLDGDGLLRNAQRGSTLIDCSTVSPSVEQKIAKACGQASISFLDAPVSGGVKGAEGASLSFLVGGDTKVLDANRDLLLAMGKNIFLCGPPGSGQVAKLCNNLILGVSMVALSEALCLGIKMGLDPTILSTIINASSGRSWASELYNPVPGVMNNVPAATDYVGGFATKLMLKDMRLAKEEADRCKVILPTGTTATEIYAKLAEQLAHKDFSAVFKQIQEMSTK